VHHESQVREHELTRRRQIALIAEAIGKRALLLAGQNCNAADALEVRIKAAQRASQGKVITGN
jgi:hypothetical protein